MSSPMKRLIWLFLLSAYSLSSAAIHGDDFDLILHSRIDGTDHPCHRGALIESCDYWKTCLTNGMKETGQSLIEVNHSSEAIDEFLRFVEDPKLVLLDYASIPLWFYHDLLDLAHNNGHERLRTALREISIDISPTDLLESLRIAELYADENLLDQASDILKDLSNPDDEILEFLIGKAREKSWLIPSLDSIKFSQFFQRLPGEIRELLLPGYIVYSVFKKRTWPCNSFHMQELIPGGDPLRNLFAPGGSLAKLDRLTDGSSKDFEFNSHSFRFSQEGEFSRWEWGYSHFSTRISCLLQAPERNVIRIDGQGREVIFTPNDIQGLLVVASSNLPLVMDLYVAVECWPENRPKPFEPFLQKVIKWAADGDPFVMTVNKNVAFNHTIDRVAIKEFDDAPQGFDRPSPSQDGTLKFYEISMMNGYEAKSWVFYGHVVENSSGEVIGSGWQSQPPQALWRPNASIDWMDRSSWILNKRYGHNPEIDMQMIYDIYLESLGEEHR